MTRMKKRPSGAAQLKSQGKTGVYLGLDADTIADIDAAAAAEGRSRANFLDQYGVTAARIAAKEILQKIQNKSNKTIDTE